MEEKRNSGGRGHRGRGGQQWQQGQRGGSRGDNWRQGSGTRGQQFPEGSGDRQHQRRSDQSQGQQSEGWQGVQRGYGGQRRGGQYERHSEHGSERGQGDNRGGGRGGGRGRGEGRGRGDSRGRGHGGAFRSEQKPDYAQSPSTIKAPSLSEGELADVMKKLALIPSETPQMEVIKDNKDWIIPFRKKMGPEVGTRGRKIQIEVNHLLLTLSKTKGALHYDVELEPDKISKKIARLVLDKVRQKYYSSRYPAFDGRKNLYCNADQGPLFEGNELTTTIALDRDDPKNEHDKFLVKVTIKPAKEGRQVDLTKIEQYVASIKSGQPVDLPQDALQVLDTALRNPLSMKFTQVGRSFFTPSGLGRAKPLGNGMELWYGFYQSAVLGWRPYLNVDVAHKGFPEGKDVLSVMLDFKGSNVFGNRPKPGMKDLQEEGLDKYQLENFEKYIKGLQIKYEVPGTNLRRKYRVNGITRSSRDQMFESDGGQKISVEQYFRKKNNYTLKYPKLPCLHVGDPKKTIYIPPEFCFIMPNQIVMKKLDPTQTKNMIKEAATRPEFRKERIKEAMQKADFAQDKCLQEFGVSVSNEFQSVPARVLEAPRLEYKYKQVRVQNGEWRADHFLSPKSLKKWAVVSVTSRVREDQLWSIANKLMEVGKEVGMEIERPMRCDALCQNDRYFHIEKELEKYFKAFDTQTTQLIFVVMPDKTGVYGTIKFAAEVSVGLLTQCMRDRTAGRIIDDYTIAKNVLLKMNTKLNGINHTIIGKNCRESVHKLLEGTMLMGADVTHPSPEQKYIPSVAAVTASHEPLAYLYNMCWRLQAPRQEIIVDLRAITRRQLQVYKARNGNEALKRIIIFRDGVSEGQFNQVLQSEMHAIQLACLDILNRVLPVTFIVVQKRHHTRFFPNPNDADRKGNVPPGTVVDTDITHPREMDFYLVSHASLQGTSRPTKYHVLWDDNNVSEDDLQELTYYLCHMFSRCTRTVSYPAPTYYAHLAASRAKAYIERANVDVENLIREMEARVVKRTVMDSSPMFFT